jgi:LmbE family N-acetylglucosaminyl deacetylase
MSNILVICAHPDDESLGLGGTLAFHASCGDAVHVLMFATGQYGRDESKKGISERKKQGEKAFKILGVKKFQFLNYDDQKLDIVPLTELTKAIENAIKKWKPIIIYTHFWGDVNQDHRRVYEATLIASKPKLGSPIKQVICYETPSSTDITYGSNNFIPNFFVDIKKFIKKKNQAVVQYKKEISTFPHPRSIEAINNRAKFWGSLVNLECAEAFVKIREIKSG